ncbi:MAG: thioesterase family protein [Steroidobacteraceae bacterium]
MSTPPLSELAIYRARIEPAWIDFNGHLRDAYYGLVASYAVDEVMDQLGLDAAYRERTHCTLYTLEEHLHFLHEVKSSDDLAVITSILDFDGKRIQVGCRFTCSRVSEAVATVEMMLLHVHQGAKPGAAPFPAEVAAKLESFRAAPAAREAFAPSSRKIELKRR